MTTVVETRTQPATDTHEADDCCPACIQANRQEAFSSLVHRIVKSDLMFTEEETRSLWQAAEGLWDDAIHVAAPWEKRSSLCGNWGRNLVSLDEKLPDGLSGCWTCIMAAEWIGEQATTKENA